ncbi:MAG: Wzt carbohydrate-binding domain-containing protein [Pseudomonadota bacterium]
MTRTIFDHIPKTAGTSVKEALAAAIGERGEMPGVSYPHHIVIKTAGQRRFIGAHMWFFSGEKLAAGWYYCTLLRDPVDRFLSQYYFHRAHREQVLDGSMLDPVVITAVKHDLEDYLADQSGEIRRSYVNMQAAHFARRVCPTPENLNDRQLLDAAISSLESYDLVGIFSDTQGFVDAYCQDLDLHPQRLPVLNVTRERKHAHDFPGALIEQVKRSNQVDFSLYDWARQRFARRRHGPAGPVGPGYRQRQALTATTQHKHEHEHEHEHDSGDSEVNFGSRQIELLAVSCLGQQSHASTVEAGETVLVRLSCHAFVAEDDLTVGIGVRDSHSNTVCGTNTKLQGMRVAVQADQALLLEISLEAWLPAGEYQVTLALHKGITHLDGCYHWIENAARFTVAGEAQAPFEKSADSTISISRIA